LKGRLSHKALVEFHTAHKCLLMAHSREKKAALDKLRHSPRLFVLDPIISWTGRSTSAGQRNAGLKFRITPWDALLELVVSKFPAL